MLSSSAQVRVRRGKLSDAKALSAVFRESWELAYRGIIPHLHLDMRRLNGLIVWALADNDAAIAFYWRRGGRPIAKRADKIGAAKLSKLAFAWG